MSQQMWAMQISQTPEFQISSSKGFLECPKRSGRFTSPMSHCPDLHLKISKCPKIAGTFKLPIFNPHTVSPDPLSIK